MVYYTISHEHQQDCMACVKQNRHLTLKLMGIRNKLLIHLIIITVCAGPRGIGVLYQSLRTSSRSGEYEKGFFPQIKSLAVSSIPCKIRREGVWYSFLVRQPSKTLPGLGKTPSWAKPGRHSCLRHCQVSPGLSSLPSLSVCSFC